MSNILFGAGHVDFDTNDSNPLKLSLSLIIGATATLLAIRRGYLDINVLSAAPLLVALTFYLSISMFWSADTLLTLRRVGAYILSTIAFIYVVRLYPPDKLLQRVWWCLLAGIVLSDILAIIAPQIAVVEAEENQGAWEGGYGDKIVSGYASVAAITMSLMLPARFTGPLHWRLASLVPAALLLVMSQSRTAWLLLALCVGVLMLIRTMRSIRLAPSLQLILGPSILLAGAGIGYTILNVLLPLMGRTESFSGRTKLWEGALDTIDPQHLITGAGYRSYWDTPQSQKMLPYIEYWGTGRTPSTAHNGYIDALLELGAIGVMLMAIFLLSLCIRLWVRTAYEQRSWVWPTWLILVILLIFENISFGFSLRHTSLYWGMCIMAALSLGYTRAAKRTA